jgi:hypothetical protein
MDNAHYKDGARGSALAVSDKIVFEPFPVTLWEIAERLDFQADPRPPHLSSKKAQ